MNGIGVSQDKFKVIALLHRAANMGNTDAMMNLGHCYEHGDGIPRDVNKAHEWYQKYKNKQHRNTNTSSLNDVVQSTTSEAIARSSMCTLL